MSGGEIEIVVSFVACAVGIPIVVIGWIRDPWGREIDRQRRADELEARRACAPSRPHVVASPIAPPLRERVCDVIEGRRFA